MIDLRDTTVVIRCKSDPRVFDCIDSVGESAEVLVSMSPDEHFERILEEAGVGFCLSEAGNLSITSNEGIREASTEKIILTDSDTRFGPGAVEGMAKALDDVQMCRASLRFDVDDSPLSGPVSGARTYVNSKPLTFTPGIGFRKSISDRIGGYWFDEKVPFAVDANLNYRVKRAGIEVRFLDDCVLTHSAESVKHDLHAARRIGAGVDRGSWSLYDHYGRDVPRRAIRRDLKAVHFDDYPSILREHGFLTAAYQIIWDTSFYIGRTSESLRRKLNG